MVKMDQNFLGKKYILKKSENFDAYMKELGIGLTLRKMGNSLVSQCLLKKNLDDSYTFILETPYRSSTINFELEKFFTEITIDNRVVQTICTLDNNIFVQEQQRVGLEPTKIVREYKNNSNELITTLTVGDVTAETFKLFGGMRYLYGEADEKYVNYQKPTKKRIYPLSSFKFRLHPMLKGKIDVNEFSKNDVPIVFRCSPDTLLNLCVKVVDVIPLPAVYTWTTDDICKWLRAYGFEQYQNTFRKNLINGHNLLLIDASALSAMNIKNFEHIKRITYGIRSLFYFEMTKFGRSITLYPEFHNELYKLFRLKTGYKYENVRRSDLWRKMQLIRKNEPNYTHWEILERWLAFHKDPPFAELFGGTYKAKLYTCKAVPTESIVTIERKKRCFCLPPCECYWSDLDRRPPWRFKCLPHLLPDKEFFNDCNGCIPPCTCRWSSKKYLTCKVLTCLQLAFPQKYGPLHTQNRLHKLDQFLSYRLSLF